MTQGLQQGRRPALQRVLIALILAAGFAIGSASVARADIPPPPPPPGCNTCKSPLPPEPVPTISPDIVPPDLAFSAKLTPAHIKRGHETKLTIAAKGITSIVVAVHYKQGKTETFHGKMAANKFSKVWKVRKSAALGEGFLKITLVKPPKGSGKSRSTSGGKNYSARLFFFVVK